MKIKAIIINGPNLNLIGTRETSIYGTYTLDEIMSETINRDYEAAITIDHFQSNYEGALIEKIHSAHGKYDFIVINPGGLTHYSICLRDALLAVNIPYVEVHMSNIFAREDFRRVSLIADNAVSVIAGGAEQAYYMGIISGVSFLRRKLNFKK